MNDDGELVRRPTATKKVDDLDLEPAQSLTWRQWIWPQNSFARAMILLSLAQMLVVGGLELLVALKHVQLVDTLKTVKANLPPLTIPFARALSVYHGMFGTAQIFQFLLTWDAVIHCSLMQIIATGVFNAALFGYSVIQYMQANPTDFYELTIIGIMVLSLLIFAFLGTRLYRIFGWKIFKQLGADARLRSK
jgi:uncharacterized membrane protein YfcA